MSIIVLKTFDNYFSANIILTRLQDAGINCVLLDENTATIYPVLGNAIGGIKLAVQVEQAPDAQILLDQFEEEYIRATACPRCGHHEIVSIPSSKPQSVVTSILTWLFSSYSVPSEYVYHCNHCNYESQVLPSDPALSSML